MTKQHTNPVRVELPSSSVVSGMASLAKTAQNHLQAQQAATREEQQIGTKTRQQMARQIGHAMISEHGQHLVDILDRRTIERLSDYVDFDRSIRDKPRDAADQADVEFFCQLLREANVTSKLTIRQQAVERIEQIVTESLEPVKEKRPHYIVQRTPGFFGSIIGGETWTRVVYDVPGGD
jgi:hypothetical protein